MDLVQEIGKVVKEGRKTPVIQCPMGWGKTTRLLVHLVSSNVFGHESIYVTMPSRDLASSIYESLKKCVSEMKSKVVIGKRIEGQI